MSFRQSVSGSLLRLGHSLADGGAGATEKPGTSIAAAISGGDQAERMRRWAGTVNVWFIAFLIFMLVVLFAVCRVQAADARLWFLFLVALAGYAAGSLVGFVYSTFGDEVERFSSFSTFFNGLLGGAVITDLAKQDSAIRAFLRSVAASTGLAGGAGLVVVILVAFGVLGFLTTYVNKRLFLNLMTALQDRDLREVLEENRQVLKGVDLPPPPRAGGVDGGAPVRTEQLEAARVVAASPAAGRTGTVEDLKTDAKALYFSGMMSEAESALRRAYLAAPRDPEVLLDLANVLITQDRPAEAIPFLEELARQPQPPLMTWYLLGYAALFDPSKLAEAEQASLKYLSLDSATGGPHYLGALINLACVYGQRGPGDPKNKDALMKVLRRIDEHPLAAAGRQRIAELARPGLDFERWVKDPDFLRWAGLPAAS